MAQTGADVARVAGVSVATVSRVFTSPDLVRPETRQKVLDAAAELGYEPKLHARPPARNATHQIGVVLPNLANPYFAGIAKAVHARARQQGYGIVLADSDEHEPDEPGLALGMADRVDGIVLISARSPEPVLQEIARQVPTVLANREARGVSSVLTPTLPGILQAVDHLRALGHTRLAHLDGGRDIPEVRERTSLVRDHCARCGMELLDLGFFPVRFDSGVTAASVVMASGATAVMANNDMITVGLVAGLQQQGVRIPGEISVVGIGDTELSASSSPALTTVRVPIQDVGRHAVDLLLTKLADPDAAPEALELPVSFVVRSSTGRAPS